jgi:hypothetical protein
MKAVPRCNLPKAAPGPKNQREKHPTLTFLKLVHAVCHRLTKIHLSVSACNFVVHDRCLKTVVSPCSSIAATIIKVTLADRCNYLRGVSPIFSIAEPCGALLVRAISPQEKVLQCVPQET